MSPLQAGKDTETRGSEQIQGKPAFRDSDGKESAVSEGVSRSQRGRQEEGSSR